MKKARKDSFAIICLIFFMLNTLSFAASDDTKNLPEKNGIEQIELKTIGMDKLLSDSFASGDDIVPGKMVVKFKNNKIRLQEGSIRGLNMVQSVEQVDNRGIVEIDIKKDTDLFETMEVLKNHPEIEYAEPLYIYKAFGEQTGQAVTVAEAVYEPDDTYYTKKWQWGLQAISVDSIWDRVPLEQRSGITIAVIDTGVDIDHPDLCENIVNGYDFVGNDSNADDDNGHGTHVAGIAAAVPYNGTGIAGVAGGARIMPVKVLDENGSGNSLDLYLGIIYAVNHGADVINLSLGSVYPSLLIEEAVEYALSKDVVVVAATGNDGSDKVSYPAAFEGVIGVGAVDYYDGNKFELPSFSNRGDEVDLTAPGVDIISTIPYELDIFDGNQDGYALKNGTSMAAPFVAGMAALLRAESDLRSYEQIQQILEETAVDVGDEGKDSFYGAGVINGSGNAEVPSLIEFPCINISGQFINMGMLDLSVTVQKGKGVPDEGFSREIGINIDKYADEPFEGFSGEIGINFSKYISEPFEGFMYVQKPVIISSPDKFNAASLIPVKKETVTIINGLNTEDIEITVSGFYCISIDTEDVSGDYIIINDSFDSCVLSDDDKISGTISLAESSSEEIEVGITAMSNYIVFRKTITIPAGEQTALYSMKLPRISHYKVYYQIRTDNDIYYYCGFYKDSGTTTDPDNCSYIDLSDGGTIPNIDLAVGIVDIPPGQEDDVGNTPENALQIELSNDMDPEYYYSEGVRKLDYIGDRDYYKLTVLNEADYSFIITTEPKYLSIRTCLYDSDKNLLESIPLGFMERHLNEGTYYLKIEGETGLELGEYSLWFNRSDSPETIHFSDENLENEIRDVIGKPTGDILESDVSYILELNINNKSITSLEGIENLKNLASLQCEDNLVTDLTPLAQLEFLIVLDLSGNEISDISPIANLLFLEELDIGSNSITSLPSLRMPSLKHLDLSHNQLSEFELQPTESLETLFLQGNNIADISHLEGFTNLKVLYLDGNPISDFSPLKTLYRNLSDRDFSSPPFAENVKINGKKTVGSTLTGSYTYTNLNDYAESDSTYKWLRSNTKNGQYSAITGATDITYKLTDADLDKYIKFEVTPKADGEPSAGLPVSSQPFGPITKSGSGGGIPPGGGGIPSGGDAPSGGIQPGISPTPTPTVTPSPTPIPEANIETDQDGDKKLVLNVPEMDFSGGTTAVIDASSNEDVDAIEVNIAAGTFMSAVENNQTLSVTSNQVGFEIKPGAIDIPEDAETVTLEAKQLSLDDLPEELKNKPDEAVGASLVYDFDLSIDGVPVTEFNEPITITIKLDLSTVSNLDKVGVYYYSEHENKWIFVGGKVNEDGTITFTINHFSRFIAMEYNKTFSDVSGHWAKEDIEVMAARHVTGGTGDNKFSPDANITRAEFTALIVRALNIQDKVQKNPFGDVKEGDWFAETALKANAAGLVKGDDRGYFAPASLITREEMAVIAMRAYSYYTGKDADEIIISQEIRFKDMDKVSSWAKSAVTYADALGIMKGFADQTCRPKNFSSRAEAIVVIKRLMKLLEIF